MEQRRTTVYQRINESTRGREVLCTVCARKIAELWGSERDANLLVARHALSHVAALAG